MNINEYHKFRNDLFNKLCKVKVINNNDDNFIKLDDILYNLISEISTINQ